MTAIFAASDTDGDDGRLYDPTQASGSVAYVLTCNAGAYIYTGQSATLAVARRLSLAVGAYAYTGQAAALAVARRLALDVGAYAYAGNAATLAYVPGAVAYTLACDAGAYAIAGNDASLTYKAGAARPLGGHFGFDEKKRNKRWKEDLDAERERRETLIAAFNGLPDRAKPEAVEAISGAESISINWQPIAVDVESFHAAIMKMAIIKAMRQDEDDVLDLIEMGVL